MKADKSGFLAVVMVFALIAVVLVSGCPKEKEELDECIEDKECDDGKNYTKDLCNGSPKKCINEIMSCSEQGRKACAGNEKCLGELVEGSDEKKCCKGECRKTEEGTEDPCKGVICRSYEKCLEGECVKKTCSELNGFICGENQKCLDRYLKAADTQRCCSMQCEKGEDKCKGIVCKGNEKCLEGICLPKNCAELGGFICGTGKECKAEAIQSSDKEECCKQECSLSEVDFIVKELGFPSRKNNCVPQTGNNLEFTYELKSEKTVSKKIKFKAFQDGEEVASDYLDKTVLSPGTYKQEFFFPKSINQHTIKVVLDPENEVKEASKENNQTEKKFTESKQDLSFYPLGSGARIDHWDNYFHFRIKRTPILKECVPFKVNVYVNEELIGNTYPTFMSEFEDATDAKVYYKFIKKDTYVVRAEIDPQYNVDEIDEGNNQATEQIKITSV